MAQFFVTILNNYGGNYMPIPNDYIKQQIARIDEIFANASQEELEDSWQGDSELYQLQAEREYWVAKLAGKTRE